MDLKNLVGSADGRRWAGKEQTDGGFRCVVDGEAQEVFDRVLRVAFTTDGRPVYQAKRDGAECVVVDGEAGPTYEGVTQLVVGGSVAYLGSAKKVDVVVNATVEGSYADAGDFAVDAAGNVAFWASMSGLRKLPAELKNKQVLFRNGEQYAVANNIGSPAFSAAGELAYLKAKTHTKWTVVVDTDEFGPYDWAMQPVRSESGAGFAAAVKRKERWSLLVDGELVGDHADIGKPCAVNGAGQYAYAACDDGRWTIVSSEQGPVGAFDSVSTVSIAADGRAAAVVRQDGGLSVVMAADVLGPYENMGLAEFHSDGRLAYWAETEEGRHIYLDGQTVAGPFDLVTDPVWVGGERVSFVFNDGSVERLVF